MTLQSFDLLTGGWLLVAAATMAVLVGLEQHLARVLILAFGSRVG
jgi:hypothetical protein